MAAFRPVGEGVVKVVVATNTAESSITLPDVDNVICLGSCKEVRTGVCFLLCRRRVGMTATCACVFVNRGLVVVAGTIDGDVEEERRLIRGV